MGQEDDLILDYESPSCIQLNQTRQERTKDDHVLTFQYVLLDRVV